MQHAAGVIMVLVVAALVLAATLLVTRRIVGKSLNSLPGYEEWTRTKQGLTWRDKQRVLGATLNSRPVDRPELENAQLAFVRFREQEAGKAGAPRRRRFYATVAVLYLVIAAGDAILAATAHGGRYLEYGAGTVLFAALGFLWAFVMPKFAGRRLPRQLAELRRDLERRRAASGAVLKDER